jgi:hypothetical protein
MEDVILPELLSDILSDVPEDILATVMILREQEKLCAQNKVQ